MKIYQIILLIVGIAMLALIGFVIGSNLLSNPEDNSPEVNLTYENIPEQLPKINMIKALPDDSYLLLQFYNFNSGQRQIEKAYLLSNSEAIETNQTSADIVLSINSKYLSELTNKNFCEIIQKANENNDLGFDTTLSTSELVWKFKSMSKYKACLGF